MLGGSAVVRALLLAQALSCAEEAEESATPNLTQFTMGPLFSSLHGLKSYRAPAKPTPPQPKGVSKTPPPKSKPTASKG